MATPEKYREQFLESLRAARKSRGITQQEMADRLDTSQQNYARYEIGKHEFSLPNLIQLLIMFPELSILPEPETKEPTTHELAQMIAYLVRSMSEMKTAMKLPQKPEDEQAEKVVSRWALPEPTPAADE